MEKCSIDNKTIVLKLKRNVNTITKLKIEPIKNIDPTLWCNVSIYNNFFGFQLSQGYENEAPFCYLNNINSIMFTFDYNIHSDLDIYIEYY